MNLKMSDFLFEDKDVQDLDKSNQADSEESESSEDGNDRKGRLKVKSQLGDKQLKEGPEILLSEMENTIAPNIAKTLFQVSSNLSKNAQLRDQTKDKKEKELSSKEKKALKRVDKVLDLPLGILDKPLLNLLFVKNFAVGLQGKIGGRIHLNPFQAKRGAEQIEGATPLDFEIAKKTQMFFAMLSNEKSEIVRCNGKAVIIAIPAIGANCTPNLELYSMLYPDVTKETPVPYHLDRVAFFLLPFDKFDAFQSNPAATIKTCLSQETTKEKNESFVYRQGLSFLLNENAAPQGTTSTTNSGGAGSSGGSGSSGGRSIDDIIIENIMQLSLQMAQNEHALNLERQRSDDRRLDRESSERIASDNISAERERARLDRESAAQTARYDRDAETARSRDDRTAADTRAREDRESAAEIARDDRESSERIARLDRESAAEIARDDRDAEANREQAAEDRKFARQRGVNREYGSKALGSALKATLGVNLVAGGLAGAGSLASSALGAIGIGTGALTTASTAATGAMFGTALLPAMPILIGAALFNKEIIDTVRYTTRLIRGTQHIPIIGGEPRDGARTFTDNYYADEISERLIVQNHLALLREYRRLILEKEEEETSENIELSEVGQKIKDVLNRLQGKTVEIEALAKELKSNDAVDTNGEETGEANHIAKAIAYIASNIVNVTGREKIIKQEREAAEKVAIEKDRTSEDSPANGGHQAVESICNISIDSGFAQALRDINSSGKESSDALIKYLLNHSESYLEVLKDSCGAESSDDRDTALAKLLESINSKVEDANIDASDIVKREAKFKLTKNQINKIALACALNKNVINRGNLNKYFKNCKNKILEFCKIVDKIHREDDDYKFDYYPVILKIIATVVDRPSNEDIDSKNAFKITHVLTQEVIRFCLTEDVNDDKTQDDYHKTLTSLFIEGNKPDNSGKDNFYFSEKIDQLIDAGRYTRSDVLHKGSKEKWLNRIEKYSDNLFHFEKQKSVDQRTESK